MRGSKGNLPLSMRPLISHGLRRASFPLRGEAFLRPHRVPAWLPLWESQGATVGAPGSPYAPNAKKR